MPSQIVISHTSHHCMGAGSMSATLQSQMFKLILSTVKAAITADMFAWLCNGNMPLPKEHFGQDKVVHGKCMCKSLTLHSQRTPLSTSPWACYSGTFEVGQKSWLKDCDPQTP